MNLKAALHGKLLPILISAWVFAVPCTLSAASMTDVNRVESAVGSQTSADMSWDAADSGMSLVEKLRGLATVLLCIALVVSALVAGITGRTTMPIFVAVGAVILYGGFWLVLLIVENLGDTTPAGQTVIFDSPANYPSPLATVVKDFIGYGVNMLTTATMPFLMIYGFWLSLGIASGESGGGPGPQIKNYVLGAVVAIGASIITQIFFRWQ